MGTPINVKPLPVEPPRHGNQKPADQVRPPQPPPKPPEFPSRAEERAWSCGGCGFVSKDGREFNAHSCDYILRLKAEQERDQLKLELSHCKAKVKQLSDSVRTLEKELNARDAKPAEPIEADYRALYGLALAEKEDLKRERDKLKAKAEFLEAVLEKQGIGVIDSSDGTWVTMKAEPMQEQVQIVSPCCSVTDYRALYGLALAEKEDLKRERDALKAEVARLNGETAKRILDHSVERSAYRKASDDVLEAANSKIREIERERDQLKTELNNCLPQAKALLNETLRRRKEIEVLEEEGVAFVTACSKAFDAVMEHGRNTNDPIDVQSILKEAEAIRNKVYIGIRYPGGEYFLEGARWALQHIPDAGGPHSPVCECASCIAKREAEIQMQLAIQRRIGRRNP